MNDITVGLLNYKRPKNYKRIFSDLRKQTLRPKVFMWDNGDLSGDDVHAYIPDDIEWYVASSRNAGCMPRWWMLAQAETDFVMTLDDDLTFADERFVADLVDALQKLDTYDRILGIEGVRLMPSKGYWDSVHGIGGAVDIVKGRLMATTRKAVNEVPLIWSTREDDIAFSAYLAKSRPWYHWLDNLLKARTVNLPDNDANWRKQEHSASREWATRAFFHWHDFNDYRISGQVI